MRREGPDTDSDEYGDYPDECRPQGRLCSPIKRVVPSLGFRKGYFGKLGCPLRYSPLVKENSTGAIGRYLWHRATLPLDLATLQNGAERFPNTIAGEADALAINNENSTYIVQKNLTATVETRTIDDDPVGTIHPKEPLTDKP